VQLLLAGTVVGNTADFVRVRLLAFVARARLSHPLRLGRGLHRYNWLLEHYSPTLVATHTYVNPSLPFCSLVFRRRSRHVKRAPLHCHGHWRGHACSIAAWPACSGAPRNSCISPPGEAKIKKARQPISRRASSHFELPSRLCSSNAQRVCGKKAISLPRNHWSD